MNQVDCKNIFITGVTGVVGGRLLYEILASTQANVYCLVRADNVQKAKQRIVDILAVYDPQHKIFSQFESRTNVIIGDITKKHFGLTTEDYSHLVQQIDQVFHVAANVNMVASFEKLAEVNLRGTSEVIEFCLAGQIPMLHTSSYSVIGSKTMEPGLVFKESDLDIGQTFDNQNYEHTKLQAEQRVHEAGNRGLKWVIVRLGDILGDSKTGCYPLTGTTIKGIYYGIIKSIVDTGLFFFLKDYFYITPVDYAAESSLHLALNPEAYGKTFHIINPDCKSFYDFVNLIVDVGYRVKILPYEKYISLFRDNAVFKEGKIYSSSFVNLLLFSDLITGSELSPDLIDTSVIIDTSNAEEFLSKANIYCHKVDIDLLSTYLKYCVEKGFIASPANQSPLATIKY
ncbi:NAD-dependent epimerase/dehydratase family protein [Nostoc sp. B(2019)]|nr:NAD-dependent epimerase/dehydratase family protein [Nostoc sp. B(2019)]